MEGIKGGRREKSKVDESLDKKESDTVRIRRLAMMEINKDV